MNSTDYVINGFLTLEQLADKCGVSVARLKAMQDTDCLPGPAYRLQSEVKVASVFGEHGETVEHDYYPQSYVEKVRDVENVGGDLPAITRTLEGAFKEEYRSLLVAEKAWNFGLESLYAGDNSEISEAGEILLDQEWQHYLAGTYGVCTRNATVGEIATKEIMIAKIKCLTEKLGKNQDDQSLILAQLAEAVDRLDQVSAPFAPHERERSSRGLYIDKVRAAYFQ